MPSDISGSVAKFIPNNTALASVITKVLKHVYQVRSLPMDLVKLVVEKAMEQSREPDARIDNSRFEDRLTVYATSLKPRYVAKLNQIRRQGKTW